MDDLKQVVETYLRENGIKKEFFAKYIGCDSTKCIRWFKGERKFNAEQIKKVHEFLSGIGSPEGSPAPSRRSAAWGQSRRGGTVHRK